jgi:hypothetical protein
MPTLFTTGNSHAEDSFAAGAEAANNAMAKRNNQKAQLSIVFAGKNYNLDQAIEGFKSVTGNIPLIGCTSAGEFTEDAITNNSIVCALISSDNHQFFTGIGTHVTYNEIEAVQEATTHFPVEVEGFPYRSAMILVDGLSGKGEEIVLGAYSILGADVKFAGGAASDNLNFKETLVFCDNTILSNSVVFCLTASKTPIIISVKHGHKPLSPTLTVTKAKNNVLYEIDGSPAFDIWKKYVREDMKKNGIDIDQIRDPQELSKILLKYEAGFLTGQDYKVRFPSSCNRDGSINFTCSVFEGTAFKIMNSNEEDQIQSAKVAAEQAAQAAKGRKIAGAVIFDCACRGMILKDKFPEAVNEIKNVLKGIPIVGFETYGEIAMEIGQLSGFHNTTTVVMLIPD